MEPLRDMSWMGELQAAARRERLDLRGYRVSIIAVRPTAAHHEGRCRYRLLAFDPVLGRPLLSVDLENDILGEFCLCVQTAAEHIVLARYDLPPSFESFRELALREAEARLPARESPPGDAGPLRPSARRRGPRAGPPPRSRPGA